MTHFLKRIDSPRDVKKFPVEDLPALAEEVRREIIRVVSRRGGHLAPSLGVVDLTIALYHVFDPPEDKVVWDVGHQSYAHKILTGRRKSFSTLRQFKGLSGFVKMSESPYDAFGAGHASTSLSAGLGMAIARDLTGGKGKVIVVLGDGALTGGLAWEALNQGCLKARDLLVILNDNDMAISPSVGAIPEYLSRIISTPAYNRLMHDIELLVKKIPSIGSKVVEVAKKLEGSVKGLIAPSLIFEELGYRYFGPVKGHDLPALVAILQNIKAIREPILLHVLTQKGKGYPPAEKDPEIFHGTEPFHIGTGKLKARKRTLSCSEIFGLTLAQLAEKDRKIAAISAAMTAGVGLMPFAHRFPERFFDVGIAEGHALTFAAGLASQGMKPVVAVYSTFLQRGYDQIVHDICLQNLPVVIAVDRAGLVGEDGPTHHGVFDLSFLRHIPNLVIMQPRDGAEIPSLLAAALGRGGPTVIRYPRGSSGVTSFHPRFRPVEIGRSETLREGKEGEIWAIGPMVGVALAAASLLSERSREFGVVDARFVKPLDRDRLLASARTGKAIVTLEEHALMGGMGSAIMECLEEAGIPDRVVRIGLPDHFIEHGSIAQLRELCGLTPEKVAGTILSRLSPNRSMGEG
jgi:1-deoxy-D-xylulose-5-phosphate synthase